MKKLLIDSFASTISKMKLTEEKGGSWIMEGEYGRADVPTENKRIYPSAIWRREIDRMQPMIAEGKVLGHSSHPSDGKTDLSKVSHVITALEMTEDGRIMGRSRIVDGEHGRQLKSIRDAGGAVGISSRGMGSTSMNEDGYEVVQEDYQYMTHDAVADPAVKTSYPDFKQESTQTNKPVVTETAPNKETSMEKKVEQVAAATEIKPVVEAVKTEIAPVVENKEAPKVLAEADVQKLLADQKKELEEAHGKALEAKLAEAKTDPAALAGKIVLEDIANRLKPFLLPEDIQEVVKSKESEIDALKKLIESKNKKISDLTEKCKGFGDSAKNSLMLLNFEKAISESEDKLALRKLVGNPRRFSDHQSLIEAVDGAKRVISTVKEDKAGIVSKEKKLREEFEKRFAEMEKSNAEMKKSLTEATTLAKRQGLKAYVLEKTRGNPNGPKILKLSESLNSKEEADALISKFIVESASSKEYNSVRERLTRIGKNSTLVEDHLKETAPAAASSGSVVEGVDAEMQELIPGMGLDMVRSFSGN